MAFGKRKKTKGDTPDAAQIPDDSGVAESDIEETLEAVRAYADGLGTEQQKLVEMNLKVNEQLSKLEANLMSLESVHTTITERLFKLEDTVNNLTLRVDGMGKAVAKMRESKP